MTLAFTRTFASFTQPLRRSREAAYLCVHLALFALVFIEVFSGWSILKSGKRYIYFSIKVNHLLRRTATRFRRLPG